MELVVQPKDYIKKDSLVNPALNLSLFEGLVDVFIPDGIKSWAKTVSKKIGYFKGLCKAVLSKPYGKISKYKLN